MRSCARVFALGVLIMGLAVEFASASPIVLQNPTASFSQPAACSEAFPITETLDGIFTSFNGWAIAQFSGGVCQTTNAETAWFETAANQGSATGTIITFTLSQLHGSSHTIGDFELSYTTSPRVGGFSDANAVWIPLTLTAASATNGALLSITGNEVEASGLNPDTSVYTITAQTVVTGITGFRLGTLLDGDFVGNGPGRQPINGNFVLTEFQVDVATVPEPGTIGLLLAGLGAIAFVRRRRA